MFRLVKSLGGEVKDIYPDFENSKTGCNKFSEYFTEKVQKIRTELETTRSHAVSQERAIYERPLTSLEPTSEEEIRKITSKMNKTCDLDPLPAKQMKQCLASVVPVITMITNTSLTEGTLPPSLKEALVHPLIKKPSLDKDVLKNYRPVSNLPLISKIIEKVVALRLTEHLDTQNLQEPYQSA
jgi:DNA-directed RNA polymerase subunit F